MMIAEHESKPIPISPTYFGNSWKIVIRVSPVYIYWQKTPSQAELVAISIKTIQSMFARREDSVELFLGRFDKASEEATQLYKESVLFSKGNIYCARNDANAIVSHKEHRKTLRDLIAHCAETAEHYKFITEVLFDIEVDNDDVVETKEKDEVMSDVRTEYVMKDIYSIATGDGKMPRILFVSSECDLVKKHKTLMEKHLPIVQLSVNKGKIVNYFIAVPYCYGVGVSKCAITNKKNTSITIAELSASNNPFVQPEEMSIIKSALNVKNRMLTHSSHCDNSAVGRRISIFTMRHIMTELVSSRVILCVAPVGGVSQQCYVDNRKTSKNFGLIAYGRKFADDVVDYNPVALKWEELPDQKSSLIDSYLNATSKKLGIDTDFVFNKDVMSVLYA